MAQKKIELVVVFLTDVKEFIIVPENYILGLDINAVKNMGKNSCRDHLIYWSDQCVEGDFYPEPKKSAVVSKTFPANDGAWFHGRTVHYTGKFDILKIMRLHIYSFEL